MVLASNYQRAFGDLPLRDDEFDVWVINEASGMWEHLSKIYLRSLLCYVISTARGGEGMSQRYTSNAVEVDSTLPSPYSFVWRVVNISKLRHWVIKLINKGAELTGSKVWKYVVVIGNDRGVYCRVYSIAIQTMEWDKKYVYLSNWHQINRSYRSCDRELPNSLP